MECDCCEAAPPSAPIKKASPPVVREPRGQPLQIPLVDATAAHKLAAAGYLEEGPKFELTEAQKHRNEMIILQLRCGIISFVLTVIGVLIFLLCYN